MEYFTPEEVATQQKISVATVLRRCKDGKYPHAKKNGGWRIPQCCLDGHKKDEPEPGGKTPAQVRADDALADLQTAQTRKQIEEITTGIEASQEARVAKEVKVRVKEAMAEFEERKANLTEDEAKLTEGENRLATGEKELEDGRVELEARVAACKDKEDSLADGAEKGEGSLAAQLRKDREHALVTERRNLDAREEDIEKREAILDGREPKPVEEDEKEKNWANKICDWFEKKWNPPMKYGDDGGWHF